MGRKSHKLKKEKKHKKSKRHSSSNSSNSEMEWTDVTSLEKKKEEGSNWLMGNSDDVGDILGGMFSEKQKKKDEKKKPEAEVEHGRHSRELNPYWKDGGCGLPAEQGASGVTGNTAPALVPSRDWLRRAYQRAVELSQEEGRTVREILEDRNEKANVDRMMDLFSPESGRRGKKQYLRPDQGRDGDRRSRSRSPERRRRSRSPPRWKRPERTEQPRWKKSALSKPDLNDNTSERRNDDDRRTERPKDDERRPGRQHNDDDRSRRYNDDRRTERRHNDDRRPERRHTDDDDRSEQRKREVRDRVDKISSGRQLAFEQERDTQPGKQVTQGDNASSSSSEDGVVEVEEEKEVTDDEINKMAAQVMRAEIMGDETKIAKLQANLEKLRDAKRRGLKIKVKRTQKKGTQQVVLTKMNKGGVEMPFEGVSGDFKRGATKIQTHDATGKRVNYFHDEGKATLNELVREEKMTSSEDSNRTFAKLAGKAGPSVEDGEYADAFVKPKARLDKEQDKDKTMAIIDHKKREKSVSKCDVCIERVPKHLVISVGETVYLSLPAHTSLTRGHCLLAPLGHVSGATQLDEDVWRELQSFKQQLTSCFAAKGLDVIFMETSYRLQNFPHMRMECVPMPRDMGDMAPIYFKKALLEAGPEWSQNKKLVELKGGNIRNSVPKGFPYFSVEFGMDGGFAHVIEDEGTFQPYFGREILGGILDKGPEFWRRPSSEKFDVLSKKVLDFEKTWQPFNKWSD